MPGLDPAGVDVVQWSSDLARDRTGEETAAHADAAVDLPAIDGQPRLRQRPLPREDVRVHRVNERPVEIEDQRAQASAACVLIPGPEGRSRNGREHLLLVVDRPALVGSHVGGIVRRYEERVDVLRGDDQPEVVADEAPPARARITRAGARVLRKATEMLPRLLGIPGVLCDSTIRTDAHCADARVLVRLKGDVDAEVRSSYVGRKNARVARARRPAVVERDRDRPTRTRGDRGLEL